MAWFQSLKGKAEGILTDIDEKTAATLNKTRSPEKRQHAIQLSGPTENVDLEHSDTEKSSNDNDTDTLSGNDDAVTPSVHDSEESLEYLLQPCESYRSPPRSSLGLCESVFEKLKKENQGLKDELAEMREHYNTMKIEASELRAHLQEVSKNVVASKRELEQHRARSRRLLSEKEELLALRRQPFASWNEHNQSLTEYLDQLRVELDCEEKRNEKLSTNLKNMTIAKENLEKQLIETSNINHQKIRTLQEGLAKEFKLHTTAQLELKKKSEEVQKLIGELTHQNNKLNAANAEIDVLKAQINANAMNKSNEDLELKVRSLTHNLMLKQHDIEVLTSERNALHLHLNDLRSKYNILKENVSVPVPTLPATRTVDYEIPHRVRVSPLDVGMARQIKRAYSVLDRISIRTGIVLRQYPMARVFLFCYAIILHLLVIAVLISYMPS